ncbi:hypothetical protein [Paenibacillus crassostreae]|uniref:Uncharacterized protein n=1 Tax=Paenibacillus crassostreae TaxID=1763538 RepID=A0A167AVA6_9BACL|nr:hypothetical protein [Paenibacillus crassostreae]AOZ93649.1 hypothetical protein LPB68_16580 [Paenibacillus crassostreae]OAB71475.1 hypothetical protein PNBC_19450 [Paenibacillus crassostreae]
MVYVGIYGGLLFGIVGWYFGRRAVAKNNGLDEVLAYIAAKSRSISWYFTIAAICVLFSLEVFGLSIGTIPSLAILLFVHLGSWGLTSLILHSRMTNDPDETGKGKLQLVQGIAIGVSILILFAIIYILSGDWRFLLAAIPPVLLNVIIMISVRRKHAGSGKKTG